MVSILGKNAWLLIVAVVMYFVEKLTKEEVDENSKCLVLC